MAAILIFKPLSSFDARWQPVTQSTWSRWPYGKIGDCEQAIHIVRNHISHMFIFFTYQHFNPFLVFGVCSYLYKSVKNNIYTYSTTNNYSFNNKLQHFLINCKDFYDKKINNFGELCVVNRVCFMYFIWKVKCSHRSILHKILNPNPLWLHTLILKTFLPCISQIFRIYFWRKKINIE